MQPKIIAGPTEPDGVTTQRRRCPRSKEHVSRLGRRKLATDSCSEGVLGQVLILKGRMFKETEEMLPEIYIISRRGYSEILLIHAGDAARLGERENV